MSKARLPILAPSEAHGTISNWLLGESRRQSPSGRQVMIRRIHSYVYIVEQGALLISPVQLALCEEFLGLRCLGCLDSIKSRTRTSHEIAFGDHKRERPREDFCRDVRFSSRNLQNRSGDGPLRFAFVSSFYFTISVMVPELVT